MNNLILTKDVKDTDGMKSGILQAKDKLSDIGFTLNVFYADTDKVFTGVQYPGNHEVTNPISPDPAQILQEAMKVTGKYKTACLIYDWNTVTPKPTNPAHHNYLLNGCTPMSIPVQFYTGDKTYPEVLCHFYLHELCHAIAFLTGQPDKTHLQYMNPEWSQKNPIDYYVHLIESVKPFWHVLEGISSPTEPIKTVTLTRRWDNGTQTLGELSVDNFNCKTLELPWRDNKPNISCIPKGTYTCKWIFSPKFGYCYQVTNVPGRSGILFHKGNFFFNVQGCILLGTHYTDLNGDPYADIANSTITIKKFGDYLAKKQFTLIIK